jgi:nucleotide-binding universal stress UspA family protein
MHVAPRPLTTLGGAEAIPPSSDELALAEAKAKLAKLRPAEGVQLETKLEVGEAAPSIVKFAREARCELIVMGTHGRSGLERLILGSVAEHVLRQAPCPVLTVRQAPAGAKP